VTWQTFRSREFVLSILTLQEQLLELKNTLKILS